jgi:hypothetical protein
MLTPLPARRRPEDYLLAGAVLLLGLLVALNWAAFAWMLTDVGWRSWLIPGMTMLAAASFAVELMLGRRLNRFSAAVTGAGVFLLIVAQATHMIEVYS